ncbi:MULTISPECIES: hypothetical protein [Actinoplanes]|uniref:hypothetical protein n=1 Tax=Actinoplanes TaxID=1865 RepID=UPI0012F8AB9C|nr:MULTISPECIES: hypothetical protein [Actinoplanes]GLY03772.1 hypothetical protein Acsp01_41510 [Actinoplanes sp. NBRC 101535]
MRTTVIGVIVASVTAAGAALATAVVNQIVPPPAVPATPEPTPAPGSGFQAAVATIPDCGQVYALDRVVDPRTGAAPLLALDGSSAPAFDDFLAREKASPVGRITVEMVFTGLFPSPTRILGVRVDGLRQGPNSAGTSMTTACEGDSSTRAVTLDMDTAPRSLRQAGRPYFDGHDLDVSIVDRETLRITVTARRHGYSWFFAIDHIDGAGKQVTDYLDVHGTLHGERHEVREDGRFRITGTAGTYGASYVEDGARFRLSS